MARSSNYAFLIYPDDPRTAHFLDFLEELHVACAVSPLHDRDTYTEKDEEKATEEQRTREQFPVIAGMPKKPHYHVYMHFDSLKSMSQVLGILAPLGVSHVEVVNSSKAYIRYLAHLDSHGKHKYEVDKVVTLNGCDVSALSRSTAINESACLHKLMRTIEECSITSFDELVGYVIKTPDYFGEDCENYLVKRAYFFNQLLKSVRENS